MKLLLPFAVSTLAEGRGVKVSTAKGQNVTKIIDLSFSVEMFSCLLS